ANISGHDGYDTDRLAIYPLPTLDWSDGMIRRVVVSSRSAALVKQASSRMAGMHLVSESGEDRGYLLPAESDAVFSDYLSASKRWFSVTPVLQSGFHNGKFTKKTKVYEHMFQHAGFPMPVSICEMPAHRNKEFFVAKAHGHDKLPRVRLSVEFAEEVNGVVALGTGRFTGLGIFSSRTRA